MEVGASVFFFPEGAEEGSGVVGRGVTVVRGVGTGVCESVGLGVGFDVGLGAG